MNSTLEKNHVINYKKVINLANADWQDAEASRISGLNVDISGTNYLTDQYQRSFHHFCTTSYLGLDYHNAILNGAISAIRETGTLRIANSKNRCKLAILDQFEQELSLLH
ncbi:conserved hypothetical protein [Shewanella denitrificans OS217]|jgi:7-keto-8-aminopelargonate synthetase-like enzyme|uniref:Uncharacterized protein n=1 Tax=Shewanella denitrificans (strain OS217 / ATCC BAA-1090 / DSM 15013) TaxID=318161 RepID=Q12QZ5_SHEDO|nr:hypothetical protein [Shewanella denitrificans]ABE54131.1 conserved hypothetical protein [Shewanella denitrificans OS217]